MTTVDRKPVGQENGKSRKRRPGRPKGFRTSVQAPERLLAMCTRLGVSEPVLTWRDLSEILTQRSGVKVSAGVVWRLAVKGIEPAGNGLRRAVGLPEYVKVRVPVCTCGVAHPATLKRCPHAPKPVRKPRRGLTPTQKRAVWLLGGLWERR